MVEPAHITAPVLFLATKVLLLCKLKGPLKKQLLILIRSLGALLTFGLHFLENKPFLLA